MSLTTATTRRLGRQLRTKRLVRVGIWIGVASAAFASSAGLFVDLPHREHSAALLAVAVLLHMGGVFCVWTGASMWYERS